jgi:hypothetical protein
MFKSEVTLCTIKRRVDICSTNERRGVHLNWKGWGRGALRDVCGGEGVGGGLPESATIGVVVVWGEGGRGDREENVHHGRFQRQLRTTTVAEKRILFSLHLLGGCGDSRRRSF